MMTLPLIDRRMALLTMAAGVATPLMAGRPAQAMNLAELAPLSATAFAVRAAMIRDFPGTLRVLKTMGYDAIEMASFPGFAGNFRGGFGALNDLKPAEIKRIIHDSGLACDWVASVPAQFTPDKLPAEAAWAHGVGAHYLAYAGLDLPKVPTMDDIKGQLDKLNDAGRRTRAQGLQMVFHTDKAVWREYGGQSATEEMMRRLDPQLVALQMDFGTIVEGHVDGAAIMDRYPGRFVSVHLRDGKPPANPDEYLPSSPMGAGIVDWVAVMRAARRCGVKNYVVEMVRPANGVFDAMKESIDYLRALKV
jgi:sugar phosphate isomerase/epimerase